ncbi:hypothetical protein [Nocardia farcinica]|uniref:hypothetical protein n=1 Tax=Nocardia farcinica TaxID=37329 RepID=UPI0018947999|nr:hypothetical protein [Nocardia farcinica]MBF6185045.1 hypothetical protein [Nocardia farcinica]MBF6363987.1 hypothetical protein [Nocardia farcinica]
MSKTGRYNPRRAAKGRNQPNNSQHRITVRGELRTPPDLRKISRAVIAIALAEAEADKAVTEQPTPVTKSVESDEEADHDDK